MSDANNKLSDASEAKENNDKTIAALKEKVRKRRDELIENIELSCDELVKKLEADKESNVQEIGLVEFDLEIQLEVSQRFMNYYKDLIDKGTACDISRGTNDLHSIAKGLIKWQEKLLSKDLTLT